MTDCAFNHVNIDALFGVRPQPIEELPQTCTCGAPLTYAPSVAFVSYPEQPMHLFDDQGNIVVTIEPVSYD